MFDILISLRKNADDLTGLDALDERRRLGLRDDSRLYTAYGPQRWLRASVTESIARAYFARSSIEDHAEIPLALCVGADLVEESAWTVALRSELPPTRILQLYLAVKHLEKGEHGGEVSFTD